MSLVALNYPPLVAAAGAGLYAVLPLAQRALADGTVSWATIQAAQVVAFGLNVFATSRPGRFDSPAAVAKTIQNSTTTATGSKSGATSTAAESDEIYSRLSNDRNAKTLLAPAGWAFSIWGLIYFGEFLMVASCLRLPESDPLVGPLKARSGPFIMAQLFHVLWAASFRPKYQGKFMFVSFAMLSGIAVSLSQAHAASLATTLTSQSLWQYIMYVLPLALHFGWTSAASLVNLNGAVSLQENISAPTMAWLGHASVVVATALGTTITVLRSAPVYGSVIAWALAACADGMTQRLRRTAKEEDQNRVGLYGARRQRTLAWIGAALCAATALVTAVRS